VLLESLDIAPLVASFGGSKTDTNYMIGTAAPLDAKGHIQAATIDDAGRMLATRMRTGTRLSFRLPLAPASASGTDGSFLLRGFDRADKAMPWKCGR
jgi:hypothetical protein